MSDSDFNKNSNENSFEDSIEYPINGILDLHYFSPRDLKNLISDYIHECLKREIYVVRIIHGKGKGILRGRVHSILNRLKEVESFRLAGEDEGGWGATVVYLKHGKK